MIFNEEFYLDYPHEEAWNFLSDMPAPIMLAPGVLDFKELVTHDYQGTAKVHIGPFTFSFRGRIKVPAIDHETYRVEIVGSASDRCLGANLSAEAHTQTLPAGPNRTRVTLEVHVGLSGVIGKIGVFILRRKARQVVGIYGQLVSEELERRRRKGNQKPSQFSTYMQPALP